MCDDLDRCLQHLKHDDNYDLAIGGSRQRIFNSPNYSSEEIFCFDGAERIAGYQPRLLLSNNFVGRSRVDQIIQNAFESGLFIKWDRENRKPIKHVEEYEPPFEITLQQAAPILALYLPIAMGMSIVTFLLERFIFWKRKQNPESQKWKLLESFFDGERHYFKNLSNEQ